MISSTCFLYWSKIPETVPAEAVRLAGQLVEPGPGLVDDLLHAGDLPGLHRFVEGTLGGGDEGVEGLQALALAGERLIQLEPQRLPHDVGIRDRRKRLHRGELAAVLRLERGDLGGHLLRELIPGRGHRSEVLAASHQGEQVQAGRPRDVSFHRSVPLLRRRRAAGGVGRRGRLVKRRLFAGRGRAAQGRAQPNLDSTRRGTRSGSITRRDASVMSRREHGQRDSRSGPRRPRSAAPAA